MKEYHKGMVEATIKGDKLSKEELIADLDYIEELENENDRLNNIIDELEKWLKEKRCYEDLVILDKLKELKNK